MQVIVFASQKGGSGKTTLTGHMAVEAGRAGYGPVGLVDTDPQGSLCGWWKQRNEPMPSLIRSTALLGLLLGARGGAGGTAGGVGGEGARGSRSR